MSNRVYRIGEVAKLLDIKTSTLRFWEDEFSQIRPKRTDKGQRYYSEKDMQTLQSIRTLLYDEGMTITGAQKALKKTTTKNETTSLETQVNSIENLTSNTQNQNSSPISSFPVSTEQQGASYQEINKDNIYLIEQNARLEMEVQNLKIKCLSVEKQNFLLEEELTEKARLMAKKEELEAEIQNLKTQYINFDKEYERLKEELDEFKLFNQILEEEKQELQEKCSNIQSTPQEIQAVSNSLQSQCLQEVQEELKALLTLFPHP